MGGVRPEQIHMLYVTHDGLLGAFGRSDVVSYLLGSAGADLKIGVISFERREDLRDGTRRGRLETELTERDISWMPLVCHRAPRVVATLWDLLGGAVASLSFARRHRPSVIHARGYLPALMALPLKLLAGAKLVFDMRGFWPEERVELGLLRPQGVLYRAAKLAERALLATADHVVVLTDCAKALLRENEARRRLAARASREVPISVIPCGVDLERFRPRPRDLEISRRHGLDSAVVIGNIGAFNRRYLTPEMFRFAFHLKSHRPDLRFVYLTAHDAAEVRRTARDAGLCDESVLVLPVPPSDVPRWLSLFRLGVFFLRPSYAAKASGFTKLGEFLAAGVPVVTNTGVGDVDRILGSQRCGLLLSGLTERDLSAFARQALPFLEGDRVPDEMRRNCLSTAVAHFALDEAVRRYSAIYPSLGTVSSAKAAIAAEAG
jgi:glycosyltransferase involved in cell wall biosynthesis